MSEPTCGRCGDRIVDGELAVRDVCGYEYLCIDGCADEVRMEWILNGSLRDEYPDAYKRVALPERVYTEAEIKAAFWAQFHGSRELWFPERPEEAANRATEQQWAEFLKELQTWK